MSDAAAFVPAMMVQCLVGLPLIVVWLVAGVMIAMRARNNQTAVFMALGGIVLAALELAGGIATSMAPILLTRQGMSVSSMGVVLSGVGIVRTLIGAVSWGLVLAALVMALGKPAGEDGPVGDD